jgi:hypothetical protein
MDPDPEPFEQYSWMVNPEHERAEEYRFVPWSQTVFAEARAASPAGASLGRESTLALDFGASITAANLTRCQVSAATAELVSVGR